MPEAKKFVHPAVKAFIARTGRKPLTEWGCEIALVENVDNPGPILSTNDLENKEKAGRGIKMVEGPPVK